MFSINLDFSDLEGLLNMDKTIAAIAKEASRELSEAVHAHIIQEASEKLHSRRDMYLDNLKLDESGSENTFIIILDQKAAWIEDGTSERSMLEALLKSSKAKTAKNGNKYITIPFKNKSPGATSMTPAQSNLVNTIKSEFLKRKIEYSKVVNDSSGKPKSGLVHSFDIKNAPLKTGHGAGQGKGPIGKVIQGPSGTPYLQGVRVYQREYKNKAGQKKMGKFVMTFRTASSSQQGKGLWDHPGNKAMNFFDEAITWGKKHFDDVIGPRILDKILQNI